MIYLDHAATTPMRREVFDAMMPYLTSSFANPSSGYASARDTRRAIDKARRQVASAIGAKDSEVYFTSGGTEANNWAILGSTRANPGKRHIITTRIEHHAVLNVCRFLEELGFEVTYLDVDVQGNVLPDTLSEVIRPDTLLVSVMMANNEVGTIEPIRELAEIAHAHGVLMHTDAIQTVGHIPVNVQELGVDFLSMSAHKFGGPKGVGALYVKSGVRLSNLHFGGAQERGMRAGTENTPGIVGMGQAIELAVSEMKTAREEIAALRDEMEGLLRQIPGTRINGNPLSRLPGHLHASFGGIGTSIMMMRLDMEGIAASSGSACTSGAISASHVMRAMGYGDDASRADIRFTLGAENTREEIAAAVGALRRILNR